MTTMEILNIVIWSGCLTFSIVNAIYAPKGYKSGWISSAMADVMVIILLIYDYI